MEKHGPVGFLEMFSIKQKLKKVFLYYGKHIRKHKHLKVTVLLDLMMKQKSGIGQVNLRHNVESIRIGIFNSKAGQYRPEKLGIQILFSHWIPQTVPN